MLAGLSQLIPLEHLGFFGGNFTTYLELAAFTISITFYVIFVWFFSSVLAERDLFELDLKKYEFVKWGKLKRTGKVLLHVMKYGVIYPFYVVAWFFIFSILLFVMSKASTIRQIALISISLVSTVRIIAYLKGDLAEELAQVIPFALLAILVSDPSFFDINLLIDRFNSLPLLGPEILDFVFFSVILEWILRLSCNIESKLRGGKENES